MATGTVYLDVDDEITSAAARIRGSEATKVALVVPYGSRIATSRMNFRLLSREAIVNNRRLSIVATDPATRALAASAGLPVFASVAEWDEAAAATGDAAGDDATAAATDAPAGEIVVPSAAGSESPPPSAGSRSRKKDTNGAPDEVPTLGLAAAGAAATGAAATSTATSTAPSIAASTAPGAASPTSPGSASTAGSTPAAERPIVPTDASPRAVATQPAARPVVRSRSMPRVGGPVIFLVAALVLALIVGGVGAFLFLPSADIVVTPRRESIGPIALVVRADPNVAAPDASANVVPALRLEVPVQVSDTFEATEKRIEEEPAAGQVEFSSLNTAAENTIARGSVVSTEGGIKYQTTAAVTLPRAQIIPPLEIRPSTRTVGIVALKTGTGGNVPTNSITVVPPNEDPTLTKVKNVAPTTGGSHEEFPRIGQEDVDAAVESLRSMVAEAFATQLESGAGAPPNASLFSETAVLGEATPSVDPATLVGKEQASFELGLNATGTVIAVDASPVVRIAETRLLANIGADYRLVEGSIEIVPGDPTVSNGEVTFPVTARAARVRILDRTELLTLVKGRSVAEARSLLAEFGEAEVTTWPDWVSTIPELDSRLTIEIVGQAAGEGDAAPSPSGSVRPSGSARPSITAPPSGTGSPPGSSAPAGSAPSATPAP